MAEVVDISGCGGGGGGSGTTARVDEVGCVREGGQGRGRGAAEGGGAGGEPGCG